MTAERLPVRKLREIIRLRLQVGLSGRAIARSCGASPSTVTAYRGRIAVAKLTWPLPPELDDDAALEALLFPAEKAPQPSRPEPDWTWIHEELKRRHVTKLLLWQEYREAQPDGYSYSQFCDIYQRWARPLLATMRQVHRPGEKSFIDFSGECRKAVLFVAVLGASNLTYAEPVFHQDLPTWIGCHVRACEYFGGVSEIWVPDNPKVSVTRADRYDPELNPTYADLARHYDAVVIPARPRRPRDKAKVEAAVLLAAGCGVDEVMVRGEAEGTGGRGHGEVGDGRSRSRASRERDTSHRGGAKTGGSGKGRGTGSRTRGERSTREGRPTRWESVEH